MLVLPRYAHQPAGFADFGPFRLVCKARDLPRQLEALRQQPLARLPCQPQDVDATSPGYTPGLSARHAAKAVL